MSYQVCPRALTSVHYIAFLLLLCSVVTCDAEGAGRTKRATKSAFTEPGVIIGIIVGVAGVLVVVGVTILLCRLFCCKHSSCCSCCERGEAYQESSVVLPKAEKSDSSTLSHNPSSTVSTHQPKRPRKSGRSSKATSQNPPEYDEVSKTGGAGSWKVLDVKKYLQQSLEANSSARDTRDTEVNNADVDFPRPLKYDFDDLENSPVVSKRNKREPVVKSLPSPASSETTVGDFSGGEDDKNPFCGRREEEPGTGYSMSEFPSNSEELQNSRYQTRHDTDSNYPPHEGRRVLPGAEFCPKTANMADLPPECDPGESYMLSPEHGYSRDFSGARAPPVTHPQPAPNISDRSHPSPRVMTNPKESYKSWDFDPSYCDGKQRVWDGKRMKIRDPMEDLAVPQTTTHQHWSPESSYAASADSSYTDDRQRVWSGNRPRVPKEAGASAENSTRGIPSTGRSYGGAVNMAYNTESTETTV